MVKLCRVADIITAPNFPDLLAEYAAESAIDGLPKPAPRTELYEAMETTGNLQALGAFRGSRLEGFIIIISTTMPHYGVTVSATESFFVGKSYRSSRAGLNLLRLAEEYTQSIQSAGLLISAPVGSRLAELMPKVGYTNTNLVFFRAAANG